MADKKKSAIQSITLNTATYTNEIVEDPTYINFFYGKNGSGKTSISREISEGTCLTWSDSEIPENYDIMVYNQDFIDDHFKTLDRLKGVFTLSEGTEEDKKVQAEIENLEKERKELTTRQNEIEGEKGEKQRISSALITAENNFQKACLNNTRELRDRYALAVKGASRNPQLSQKINTTPAKDCDEEELKKLYDLSFNSDAKLYPLFPELDGNEHIAGIPDCPLLAEEITSSGTTQFAGFVKRIQALDWIDAGHKRFHDTAKGICPYCQKELDDDFEEKLASCFDEEYQNSVEKIRQFRERYRRHMGVIYTIISNALQQEILPSNAEHVENIKLQLDNIAQIVQNNLDIIDKKLSNPATSVEIADLTGKLLDINYAMMDCNKYIDENNRIVSSLKTSKEKCIADVWGLFAFRMQGEVKTYRQAQADAQSASKTLDTELENIKSRQMEISDRLAILSKSSTTIQAAIDSMNKLLHDSGFEGFEIIKSDAAKDAYKVVRPDRKVAVRLSDGERHFLSFLYFYSQVKGCNPDGTRKEKIVVIDDPVSSLDGNALFIISSIVREMIEICYNSSDYRGHKVKGDFIKQIFILTHNAQFHRSITYNQVGRYECVNFYKISKLDNHSSIKLCRRNSSTEAGEQENYNPVKNAYAALWTEYSELKNEIALMNVIHRILDFYFLDICGEDGMDIRQKILEENRDKFIGTKADGTPDMMPFHLADSMLQYMTAGVDGDMTYVSDGASEEQIKATFKDIFDRLGQGQHYAMMMERART